MNPLEAVTIFAAGMAAGTINTIVGSGSLITFPTLLLFGYSPLVANVSNTVGLVPGSISGALGYRRELAGQRNRAIPLAIAALIGGLSGGCLLLVLPAFAFRRIVPILVLLASLLMALQPWLARALAERRIVARRRDGEASLVLVSGVFLTAVYGGYFGAAQSVILIAVLSIFLSDSLQRLNGLKNALTAVVNLAAAVLFTLTAPIAWPAALLIAIGSTVGGQLGAVLGRRLSPLLLRSAIIAVGVVVGVSLLSR